MQKANSLRHLNLLVTGGAGFIGSNFVEKAVHRGHQIVILDSLTYAGHRENLDGITGPGQFELVIGNICNKKLLADLFEKYRFDALINFAAESHVDRSIAGPAPFIETNIGGTYNLLNVSLSYWQKMHDSKKENFRFLHVSTDEVYGSLGPEGKFNEKTPMAPNSPYSASKASADLLTRAWHHTFGLPTLTTNCSNNYGPRQFPEKLIPHMITCALQEKPLPVYGDGGNIRDWIHVSDHCHGILLALEKGKSGATYCFGGDAERKNIDLVQTLCNHLDQLRPRKNGESYNKLITFVKDRLGHDKRYAIDDSLSRIELSFTRQYQFESGLENTIRWYLENSRWAKSVLSKG